MISFFKTIISKLTFKNKGELFLFQLLGYHSENEIYKKAFIHKSSNKNSHNERLEYLGDAILSSIVSESLFNDYPNEAEGFLSQKRSIIVGRKHLNLVGKKIIPAQEIKSKLNKIPLSVYGNTLEAILGAIYIDKGFGKTNLFVQKHIYTSEFLNELSDTDFKSKLLKYSQKENINMEYKVEKQEGPDHKKEFLIAIYLNNNKIAEAKGSSKKEAEQKAAKKAYKIVF
ncbi:MAG: ribonuclease III [Flavobacteriales bacterium]|nr:ribonuclease III [Flavobacteriales bacterium]